VIHLFSVTCVVLEKKLFRLQFARGEQKNTLPALRQTESPRIDDPVGPRISESLQPRRDVTHCRSFVQLEHEGHVFQKHVGCGMPLKKSKDLVDESRSAASDTHGFSRLGEILTGKSGGQQLRFSRKVV
jgi:hypothetical protein